MIASKYEKPKALRENPSGLLLCMEVGMCQENQMCLAGIRDAAS